MTRDEILNMPAGREMDVLIADILGKSHGIWNFSTDIAAVWEVVQRLEQDWEVELSTGHNFRDYPGQSYGCRIASKCTILVMFCLAESAPLAICRAALLAFQPPAGEGVAK